MAFDNSPVTRWRSWQTAAPGMFVEVDFGRPQPVDAAVIESTRQDSETKVKLEGMDPQGQWTTLSSEPVPSSRPITVNLRLAASAELKARGIRYVMVEKNDLRSEDFQFHSKLWGMKCIGEVGTFARLYYIE